MLSGPSIKQNVKTGQIKIDPFDETKVGCASIDIHLAPVLKTYKNQFVRDVKKSYGLKDKTFDEEGLLLQPGQIYIGHSIESVLTTNHIVHVSGLMSVVKHGIKVEGPGIHPVGHGSPVVLSIHTVEPVWIYPNMRIAQISFSELTGPIEKYDGRHKGLEGVVESKSYEDFAGS